jgi:putative phosphonate metabolism protein
MMSETRYAVYFAPAQGSGLERVCSSILGRCARTGRDLRQPCLPGVEPERLAELTSAPRHYGLHGTLKPPFFLAEGATETGLTDAVAALAAGERSFDLPPLRLEPICSFLALTPQAPCQELDALARACVTQLDSFRREPSPEELARRRARGLSAEQDRLLAQWGYPFVLQEFRFHLTLTGSITDPAERQRVRAALVPLLSPVLGRPVPFREICIFRQPDPSAPFTLLRSLGLRNTA